MNIPRAKVGARLLLPLALAGALGASPARHAPASPPDAAGAARAPRRVALLIGIADYQHFTLPGRPGRSDLQGPLNDVERMRASLRRWGFDGDDVRVVTDRDASREGIARAFGWLAERAADPADAVVVFYSGHGSYAPDTDGDEAKVTAGDTQDEGLVPWDASDIHAAGQLVLDDQLREWLARLGTRNVTVIVDGCYSGTATRGEEEAGEARPKGVPGSGTDVGIELVDSPDHALITASTARQTAVEMRLGPDGKFFGVLTYYLTAALDGARPTDRYDELMRRLEGEMRAIRVNQTPQLEGARGARVFHVQGDVPRRAFALATPRRGGGVVLDVGAVHGIRPRASFDVYPPGEVEFRGTPLARVRVDSVAEQRSTARVVAGAPAPPRNARAVLARVPTGAGGLDRLPVHLSPGLAGLRPEIESLPWVALTDSAAAATHVTRDARGRLVVLTRGIPVQPTSPGEAQPTRGGDLCGPLARSFAIVSYELVENPAPPGDEELKVQLRVVPMDARPAEGAAPAVDTAFIGRSYDIFARVDAPAGSAFYLSAATEGYTGPSFVLFPRRNTAPSHFPAGQWVRLGRFPMEEPAGLELLKVVVSSDPYDLHPLAGSFPACDRGVRGPGAETDAAVTGWKAVSRRLLVLPPRP